MGNTKKNNNVLCTIYFSVLIDHIKTHGFIWLIKKIIYRCLKELAWILLLPISIPLHLLRFRRLLFRVEHIGHLAAEFDTYVKAKQLGLLPKKSCFYFVLAPKKKVSNVHLLNYWRSQVPIITNFIACAFLNIITKHFFMRYDVSNYISSFFGTQDIYRINKMWDKRPPLLTLSDADKNWGKNSLEAMGISADQWFVCLHVREGGFLPHNELIQSHRNASIGNMTTAIEEIVRRGGKVVRMGDKSMTPLPLMRGVIDYAHNALKSERMDVVLCAKAKFFLGCTSGLSFVSMVFGVPIAQANMIPVAALSVTKQDISIPKLLWSELESRYLSFNEILSSPVGDFYFTQQYNKYAIRVEENSSEDIYELTVEMLDRLEEKFIETNEDKKLHEKYLSFFKPGHYSYGAISHVCIAFLRRHQYLFDIMENLKNESHAELTT